VRRSMPDSGPARRCLPTLMAGLLLVLSPVADGRADEWEKLRESYDNTLRASERRIGEIESRERGIADQYRRAEKITRDKVASVRVSLKGGGKGKSLADAAEKASGDPKALADLSREQGEYLDVVQNEWGAEGPERKKLREAMAAAQRNFERVSANLTKAAKTAESMRASDVLEKAAAIEVMVTEAGERLRARWQLEQAARERETRQREREAAERARGTR
jgi:hypothetical protein